MRLGEYSVPSAMTEGRTPPTPIPEPIRNNRQWQGRLMAGSQSSAGTGNIVLDLGAVKQNSKSRKTGVSTVEIAISNIEKANLVPEI